MNSGADEAPNSSSGVANAPTVDLNASITTQIQAYEDGSISVDVTLTLGDVSLGGVLNLTGVSVTFTGITVTGGHASGGTVTVSATSITLNLGSTVTSSVSTISGSYDVVTKKFSLTFGETHIAFSSFVNIDAAGGAITYDPNATTAVTVTDGTTPVTKSVSILTIGITDASVFAGLNGPVSNPSAVGVSLTHANLALVLMKSTDGKIYHAVKTTADSLTPVGMPGGFDIGATEINIEINGSNDGDKAVDFTQLPGGKLTVQTGVSDTVDFDFDAPFSRVAGTLSIDFTDYIHIEGSFSFEKSGNEVAISLGSPAFDGATDVTFVLGNDPDNPFFTATGSLSMKFDASSVTIITATLTVPGTFTLGPVAEIETPSVTVSDLTIEKATGEVTGRVADDGTIFDPVITISAASATLFPGNASVTATVSATSGGDGVGIKVSLNLRTFAFRLDVQEFHLAVGTMFTADASGVVVSYDPEDPDPHQLLVEIGSGDISFDSLGIYGNISNLQIYKDGFHFDSLTIGFTGDITIGSILTVTDPSITITDFGVTFGGGNVSFNATGSITLAAAALEVNVGSSSFTGTDLTITFNLDPAQFGQMLITAGTLEFAFGSTVTVSAEDVAINTDPADGEAYLEIGTATASLTVSSLTLTGSATDFAIINDGGVAKFEAGDDFSISFSATPATLNLPSWLGFSIEQLKLTWDDFGGAPGDFDLTLSASINSIQGLPGGVTVSGSITNAVIDTGKLAAGEFPITRIDGFSGSVEGQLFGLNVNAAFVMGVIEFNASGGVVNPDGTVSGGTDPDDDVVVGSTMYVGVAGGAEIVGLGGVQIYLGFSSLGPLTVFISAQFPLLIEPTTGLAIGGFSGGISFNQTLPVPADPFALRDPIYQSPADISVNQWEELLKQQTASQYAATSGGEDLSAAYSQPMVIRAGVTIYDAYVSQTAFKIVGDIAIGINPSDLSTITLLLTGTATFGDSMSLKAYMYATVPSSLPATPQITFLLDAPAPTPGGPSIPPIYSVGGTITFGFTEADGTPITPTPIVKNPDGSFDEPQTIAGFYISIDGVAEFSAAGALKASVIGSATLTVTTTFVKLDVSGVLTVSYLGEIASAQGSVVLDYADPDDLKLYGALRIAAGAGLAKLEEVGLFIENAAITFQINTTGEDQTVFLPDPLDPHNPDAATQFDIDGATIFQLTLGGTTLGTFATMSYQISGEDVFYLEGAFDLRISATGLEMFANVNRLIIGTPADPIITFRGFGLFVINDSGIAAEISLTLDANLINGVTLNANFMLVMNTTSEDVVYTIPDTMPPVSIYDNDGNLVTELHSLTIPRGPPRGLPDNTGNFASVGSTGPYIVVTGSGTLDVVAIQFSGYFRFELSYSATDGVIVSLVIHMQATVPGLAANATFDGGFQISDAGLVAFLTVNAGAGVTTDYGAGISLEASASLLINSTTTDVTEIGGITLPTTLTHGTYLVQASGKLSLYLAPGTGFVITGIIVAGTTTINSNTVSILSVSGTLTATIAGETLLSMSANGGFLVIPSQGGLAGKVTLTASGGDPLAGSGFYFNGSFELQVNTTGAVQTVPFGSGTTTVEAGFYSRIHINGSLIFGTASTGFSLYGDFYFEVGSNGLVFTTVVDFKAMLDGTELMSLDATGALQITASGLAASFTLTASAGSPFSGDGFSFTGSFILQVNTTGSAIPTIGAVTVNLGAGPYFKIAVTGSIALGAAGTGLSLEGGFTLILDSSGLEVAATATLKAKIGGTTMLSLTANGALLIKTSGIAAKMQLQLGSGSPLSGTGFAFDAGITFVLELNSTGAYIASIAGQTVNLEAGGGFYFRIQASGFITVASFVQISGSFTLTLTASSLEVQVFAAVSIFGVGLTIQGQFGIYTNGIAINLALKLGTDANPAISILGGVITLKGSFQLQINTTGTSHFGISGGTLFKVVVSNVSVYVFGFKLASASLTITVDTSGHFDAAGHLNFDFFGFATVDITFHFNSNGKYTFTGSIYVQLGSDDWNIHGNLSVRFSNEAPPNFRLHVSGGVTAFGYDFASIGADVEINGTSVDISVYVSVDLGLFEVGGTVHIHLGSLATVPPPPPPAIASVLPGGVLRLNLGADAPTRGVGALATESYQLTAGSAAGQVYVYAPGIYGAQILYTGVTSILVNGTGSSDTTIQIAGNVTVPVNITAGTGKNQFIMGGGLATITGTSGTDKVVGGSGGVHFHAGTGPSQFIGGRGDNIIWDPTPVEIIQGYQVTDGNGTHYFYFNHYTLTDAAGGSGYTYTLTYQDSGGTFTNQLVGTNFNITLTTPGSGAATFTVSNFSGGVLLNGNGNAAATASVAFDGNLTLNGNFIQQSNGGTVTLQSVPALQLYGGPSDNTLTVNSWSGTSPLLLDGKGGSDTYKVNFVGSGSYTVNVNDTGASGADALIVNGTAGNDTLNVTAASISRGTETVNYTGVESIVLNTFDGVNVVNVNSPAGDITINGGAENDTFHINASAHDVTINTGGGVNTVNVPVMNNLTALLTVNGDGTDTLNLDDTTDATPNTGVLGLTSLTGIFGAGGAMSFGQIETMNLNLGPGGNTLTIAGRTGVTNVNTGAGSDTLNIQAVGGTFTVNLSTGTHTINIGSLAPVKGGTLDKVKGTINITGAGNDTMNVDDSGSSTPEVATLRPTSLTFEDPVVINFTGVAYLNIWLSQGADLLAVEDTYTSASVAPVIAIDGNGGDDIFSVLDTHAVMTINGGDGDDSMYIFGNSSVLYLNGDAGDDSFFIFASVNANGTNLDPGGASSNGNQIYSYRVNAPVNINGGTGNDKIYIFATVLNDFITIDGAHVTGAGIDVNFVNCEQLTVAGLGGDDTFYILAITIPTVVMGDGTLPIFPPGVNPPDLSGGAPPAISFNDVFFVPGNGGFTPGKLSVITASLTLNGNEGSDVAYVDNSGDRGNRSFVLTPTTFTGDGFGAGGSIIYDNTLDDLNITSGTGNDLFTINGTGAGFQTTIDGGPGNDAFVVNAPLTTPIALHGDANTFLGDTLTVNGADGVENLVLTGFTIEGAGATIAYGTIEYLTINGQGGDDTFTVNGDSIPTTINGNGGNDRFTVNANSVPLVLNGNAGNDQFLVTGDSGSLTMNGGDDDDHFTYNGNSDGGSTANGDAGNDSFVVNAISSPVALNGGEGDDSFTVNAPVAAAIAINGGTGAADQLTLNGTAGNDFWVVTSNTVSGAGGLVTYSSLDALDVNGIAGNDVFNVRSTSALTTINTGGNASTVNVGSLAPVLGGVVDNVMAALIVVGNGADTLNVDDTGNANAKTGQLTATTLTGLDFAGITFGGMAFLNISLGSAGDTLLILNTSSATTTVNGNGGFDTFNIRSTTGTTNLNGGAGNDTVNLGSLAPGVGGDLNALAGLLNVDGGDDTDVLNVDDTADPSANIGSLTATELAGLGLGNGVGYLGIEWLNLNLGPGSDTFNVQSTHSSTTTTLNSGAGANTLNVGSKQPAGSGVLDNVQGPLILIGSGNDTLNADDSADTTSNSGTLTPTTLTGLGMGVSGITFSGLSRMNVALGSGNDSFTVNELNNATVTAISGGAGVDTATLNFAGDFAAVELTLTGFEHGTMHIGVNFTGLLNDDGTLEIVEIGGSLTSTGILNAGSIVLLTVGVDFAGLANVVGALTELRVGGNFSGLMTVGGAMQLVEIGGSLTVAGILNAGSIASMTVGGNLAGLVNVAGLLDVLSVSGGTPGKIVAGDVHLITVLAGFGNKVLQVVEGGVERQIQAAPLAGGTLSDAVKFGFAYDSIASGNPQLALRVSNPTGPRFDLSLVVYSATAKFNLARVDANGPSWISNLSVEGDVLSSVSAAALSFFSLPLGSVSGVELPLDALTGIAVRHTLPTDLINVASLQGVAFALMIDAKGKTISTATGFDVKYLWRNPLALTPMLPGAGVFRVAFSEVKSVTFFLNGNADLRADAVVVFTDQMTDQAAVRALITVSAYASKTMTPPLQSIELLGDGGSFSTACSVANVTSTGPLGDVTIKGGLGLGNLTAPSIFGNINITSAGITGVVQTTGIWIDSITGTQSSVKADIGRLISGRTNTVTTITTKYTLFGQIICRGDLVSQVKTVGVTATGLIAVQGNLGATLRHATGAVVTDASGKMTRYGGLVLSGNVYGSIVVLGNTFGDILVSGLLSGRIAVAGAPEAGLSVSRNGILGGIRIANLAATSAVVSGGTIGDAANKAVFTGGGLKGLLAAKGAAFLSKGLKLPATSLIQNAASPGNANGPVISAIFTNNLNTLALDVSLGDLQGLSLIRTDLASLINSAGLLSGPVP